MWTELRPALVLLGLLTALTGIAYPLAVTGLANVAMGSRAGGSLIRVRGATVGSELLGQSFENPGYFWSRPSATSPQAYNAAASTGSNLGPSNPALMDAIRTRVARLRAVDPDNHAPVPVDLVTSSASGLDPDITPAAALYQASRIARFRGISEASVRSLVAQHIQPRVLGILGEPRVNVLLLNMALDEMAHGPPRSL